MFMTLFMNLIMASDNGGNEMLFLLLGPASGVGFYSAVYLYYRNTNKSHEFERETSIKTYNMKRQDVKKDEIRGTRESRIRGENTQNHRQRVYPL